MHETATPWWQYVSDYAFFAVLIIIALGAGVRIAAALMSRKVRGQIASKPLLHGLWFVLAATVAGLLLLEAPICRIPHGKPLALVPHSFVIPAPVENASRIQGWAQGLNPSNNMQAQYMAVSRLHDAAVKHHMDEGALPLCPPREEFVKRPDFYAGKWREWWQRRGTSLMWAADKDANPSLRANETIHIKSNVNKEGIVLAVECGGGSAALSAGKPVTLHVTLRNNSNVSASFMSYPPCHGIVIYSVGPDGLLEAVHPFDPTNPYNGSIQSVIAIDLAPGGEKSFDVAVPASIFRDKSKKYVAVAGKDLLHPVAMSEPFDVGK